MNQKRSRLVRRDVVRAMAQERARPRTFYRLYRAAKRLWMRTPRPMRREYVSKLKKRMTAWAWKHRGARAVDLGGFQARASA